MIVVVPRSTAEYYAACTAQRGMQNQNSLSLSSHPSMLHVFVDLVIQTPFGVGTNNFIAHSDTPQHISLTCAPGLVQQRSLGQSQLQPPAPTALFSLEKHSMIVTGSEGG